jgi:putative transposase
MRTTFKDRYYHVYSRGIDKRNIFLDEEDYLRFMALINICNKRGTSKLSHLLKKNSLKNLSVYKNSKKDFVKIDTYILMPNHFHIAIQEKGVNNLGKFKQRVLNAYTKYFNDKYNRKGHIFESKYKFKIIESDTHLDLLRDYIYTNPLKLIDPNYKHIDLYYGNRQLTEREVDFLKKYPHFYSSTSDVDWWSTSDVE